MPEAKCPYCLNSLSKVPSRKARCPHCGNIILIRDGQLVTEKEANKIDDKWRIAEKLKEFNILEPDFEILLKEQKNKTNVEPDPMELIHSIALDQARRIKDPEALSYHYYKMAIFMNEQLKDFWDYLVKARLYKLYELKRDGIKKVKIITSHYSCPNCLESKNKEYTVDEAIEKMPIPNKSCTHIAVDPAKGFCECVYDSSDEIVVDLAKLYELSRIPNKENTKKPNLLTRIFKWLSKN
jgi:hypothetical protein